MMLVYCDGASKGNPGPASIGVAGIDNGEEIFTISEKIGISTNNQAEWTSLLEALKKALANEYKEIHVYMDSELVVKQIKGEYRVKNPELIIIKSKVDIQIKQFSHFQIEHIPRHKNQRADELANLAFKSE